MQNLLNTGFFINFAGGNTNTNNFKMETFASRLKHFIETEGMTSTQFADACSVPRPSLSQILSGRNKKISDILIGSIHSVFPNLNVVWLMFGEGAMYVDDTVSTPIGRIPTSTESVQNTVAGSSSLSQGETSDRGDQPLPLSPAASQPSFDFIEESETASSQSVGVTSISVSSPAKSASERIKLSFENPVEPSTSSQKQIRATENGLTATRNTPTSRMITGNSADYKIADLQRQIDEMRKNLRRVSQITVYYDDSTFETFVPKGR